MSVQTLTHDMTALTALWIDDEKEHGEACEEKEQRKVQKCGQRLNCPRKISTVRQRPRAGIVS